MSVPLATGANIATLAPSYDPLIVVLSLIIAVGASFAALEMTNNVTTSRGHLRWSWLLAGALTMGLGIWSMHFTGMLAFRYPLPTEESYDLLMTALSLVPAVLASGLALFLASRKVMNLPNLVAGGLAMGSGIATMHYTGMQAMRGPCVIGYTPGPFAASLAIAVAASSAALWLAFRLKNESVETWSWYRMISALVMGGGIAGMHYTGMAAGQYVPMCSPGIPVLGLVSVSSVGGSAIAFGSLLMLAVAILDSYRERLRQQQDLLKDRLLGILFHELRTPLNAIVGYGSILEDGLLGPITPEQGKALRRMMEGAESQLRLVDDLLAMGSIYAGRLLLNRKQTDFAEVARLAFAKMTPVARQKQVGLVNEVASGLKGLEADALRVDQVLVNLLENAIKFTPAGGTVRLRARDAAGSLLVEVQDTGKGIAGKDLARLFQPFTQLDMSETRDAGGTGLGLSISRALVEAHGGTIGVKSEPDLGSTFWFTLPRR